jgi:hypothetical protein
MKSSVKKRSVSIDGRPYSVVALYSPRLAQFTWPTTQLVGHFFVVVEGIGLW